MKQILTLMITICSFTLFGQTWTSQSSSTTNWLGSIYFVNSSTGYAGGGGTSSGGSGNKIIKTTDGGSTWTNVNNPSSHKIKSLQFLNASDGWAVGFISKVIKTTNGGSSWTTQTINSTGASVRDLHFFNSNTGIIVGGDGDNFIERTTDGGSSWTIVYSATGNDNQFHAVHFPTNSIGYVVGGSGEIMKTTNGGSSWSSLNSPTTKELSDVHFVSSTVGWIVGGAWNGGVFENAIYKTTNGGTSWTLQSNPATNWLNGIHFLNANEGWIVGHDGTILETTNGGNTWTSVSSGTTQHLEDIHFYDANNGWIVGFNGTILKYNPPIQTFFNLALNSSVSMPGTIERENQSLTITCDIKNTGNGDFTGKLAAGLYQGGVRIASIDDVPNNPSLGQGGSSGGTLTISSGNSSSYTFFKDNLISPAGSYEVRIEYTEDGGNNWDNVAANGYNNPLAFTIIQGFGLSYTNNSSICWAFPPNAMTGAVSSFIDRQGWNGGQEGGASGGCGHGCGGHWGSDYYADDWNNSLYNDNGEDFFSPISGTVIFASCKDADGDGIIDCDVAYGRQVVVQSDVDPNFAFRVAHLSGFSVNDGDYVNVGTVLGQIGNSGTGSPHAHCVLYKNINNIHNGISFVNRLAGGEGPGVVNNTPANNFAAEFTFDATCNNGGASNTQNLISTQLIHLYPNPVSSEITISLLDASENIENIIIYDILGNVIKEEKTNKNIVNLSLENLSTGYYLIKISLTNGKYVSEKIIKN